MSSIRKIKRVQVESGGFRQDIRNLGYASIMLDYVIKLIVDEGYEEAFLGPMLVENLPVVKVVQKMLGKILGKEGYSTEQDESITENLGHTIYSPKDTTEIGGGVKILRYCTPIYQF
jgi:hypothetical protein